MKSEYGKIIVRIAIALVVLWFGITQLRNPDPWTGLLPAFLPSIVAAKSFIIFNGVFEVVFGLLLLLGIYVRFAALILWIHILLITINLGYGPVAVRDFGLAFASLAIFFNGHDRFCILKKD